MPAVSKSQYRYINLLRRKYGTIGDAPDRVKWVFEQDWTQDVDYDSLPKKAMHLPALIKIAAVLDPAALAAFQQSTGTTFDPNSRMDRDNLAAMQSGGSTQNFQDWTRQQDPRTATGPSANPTDPWGDPTGIEPVPPPPAAPSPYSAGPQGSPLDRQMATPQGPLLPPPAPAMAGGPADVGPQQSPLDRQMTAPMPPASSIPGMPSLPSSVGSSTTAGPSVPMISPPAPAAATPAPAPQPPAVPQPSPAPAAAPPAPPPPGGQAPPVNGLTGQPFGYRPPGTDGPPQPQAPPPSQPPNQFLQARNRIEAMMPVYESLRARQQQGLAEDTEVEWLRNFQREVEGLRGSQHHYTDNSRTRGMEVSDPRALEALRHEYSLPRMNLQSGTYGY